MRKILITGGAGYIGSMLATELVKDKKNFVTVIDLLKYSKSSINHLFFFDNFNFIKEDITKISKIKKIIKNSNFIIPLAALVGAPLCEKNKRDAKKINFDSIKNLISVCKENQKIIYPTTNSGYGIGEKNKFCDENTPLKPISLYGVTKVMAEEEVMKFRNSVSLRLATVFGASFRMRSDLIVNNFVESAVNKKKLIIFEPKFRRNFIHLRDVVFAFCHIIENFNKFKGEVYNLGLSSANITKLQLAIKIKRQLPKTKIIIKNFKKDPDQRDYFVSNKKIEKKGLKAKISLEKGINELINVFYNNKNILNNY
jgi:nucleoside-diphosphate-sugar epimerase